MIETGTGDLLKADVQALVNTVNTEGVMGKGIALQFKQAFPENFKAYKRACDRREIQPGRMFVHDQGALGGGPRYIVNFPTKRHWRSKSRIEDIESGLTDLVRVLQDRKITSIALPPLGCGNGGLNWADVGPRVLKALEPLSGVRVVLFTPSGGPPPRTMKVRTSPPAMTVGRAALLAALSRYGEWGSTFTKLEIQKLAYFLQYSGENLRLSFSAHLYGPYADDLNHVLERIEGHFIRGFGDRSERSQIQLVPSAVDDAEELLKEQSPSTLQRLDRIASLFEGYANPTGAELLSTVHWLGKQNPLLLNDGEAMVAAVHKWSERKGELFDTTKIKDAVARLKDQGWAE